MQPRNIKIGCAYLVIGAPGSNLTNRVHTWIQEQPATVCIHISETPIRVEHIRTLHTTTRAGTHTHAIVWIPNAHQLHASVANALLKFLEEPPPNISTVLSSPSTDVLETIRSRCHHFFLNQADTPSDKPSALSWDYSHTEHELIDFETLNSYSLIQRFNHSEIMAKDKIYCEYQLLFWLEWLVKRDRFSPIMNLIVEKIKKIQYNCNIKLQLDELMLSIH